ncbi:MAG TPA: alpha/beta fold hydrolase [Candidatus Dormibacteraeota bacterium]|nr:alpha/beta fold hydrolase [Candidatus Dormibacteraeota bacterium]
MRAGGSREAGLPGQAIGFLTHRGGRIAYAVTGSGPPLLLDLTRIHHLEAYWRYPPYRRFVQRLARHFTVVRWDRPGFGLSDREPADLSPGGDLAQVECMASFLGGGPVAILAGGGAAPTMVAFAARHPASVSRLALFGTAAQGPELAIALAPTTVRALRAAPAPAIHGVLAAAATAGCEPEVGSWMTGALEASADVRTLARLAVAVGRIDVRAAARSVRAPTLVLHRRDDVVVPLQRGRELADRIPGAEFVALPGASHPLYVGETGPAFDALLPFLGGADGEAAPAAGEAPLSPREREVAQLVTLGLTNAEIGRRLAIRRRTVDAHMEHIRAKLSVSSRARIAAWATHDRPQPPMERGA